MYTYRIDYRVYWQDSILEDSYDLVSDVTAKEASSKLKSELKAKYAPRKVSVRTITPKTAYTGTKTGFKIPKSSPHKY